LLLTSVLLGVSAAHATEVGLGRARGDLWQELTDRSTTDRTGEHIKLFLVTGICDGILAAKRYPDGFFLDTTYEQPIQEIDTLYATAANRQIPLVFAVSIAGMKISGVPPDKVAEHIEKLRWAFKESAD
jgi:hypothetical protein